jgi:glutamate-1-semialdehyde 2,1-aminomutase
MPKADSPPLPPHINLAINVKSQPVSDLESAVAAAKQRFVERNPISGKLFEEATKYLPGGNTRTLLYSAPFPICMKKGEAYKVFDEDGHE